MYHKFLLKYITGKESSNQHQARRNHPQTCCEYSKYTLSTSLEARLVGTMTEVPRLNALHSISSSCVAFLDLSPAAWHLKYGINNLVSWHFQNAANFVVNHQNNFFLENRSIVQSHFTKTHANNTLTPNKRQIQAIGVLYIQHKALSVLMRIFQVIFEICRYNNFLWSEYE